MRSPYRIGITRGPGYRIFDDRLTATDPLCGMIATARKRSVAELIVKALNRLPETETEFRNARLTERRHINNSPEGETT